MNRVGCAALGLVLMTGCTASPPSPAPEPTPARSVTASAAPSLTVTPSPTPSAYAMPLALVVHASRTVADVPLAKARRLVAEGGDSWRDLGQGSGRMRVLRATQSSAAEVLRRVRSDTNAVGLVLAHQVDATVRALTVDGQHPLRNPGNYPLELRAAEPVGSVTTVTVVGDIMLGRRVGRSIAGEPERPFAPLARRLASADITVGNLESTLSTDGPPTQGGDSFAASPRVLRGLQRAGFDLVSLANNHLGDYGNRAMRETFGELRDADLPYVGAGRDLAEARKPVIIERDGVSVGFYATESIGETPAAGPDRPGTNRLNMPPRTGPLNRDQLDRAARDIEALAERVDTVVVIPHWGTQYTHRVESSQRAAAKAFTAAGADLVVGGHPHWVQGFEQRGGATVVYSLGNFIFDMDFQVKTREGVFVEIVLWDGEVKAVEPVPYTIDARFTPRLARGDRAARILDDLWSSSRGPFADR